MNARGFVAAGLSHALAAGALVAVSVAGLTHEAPTGSFVGTDADRALMHQGKPSNVPAWETDYAERFPGCVESLPAGVIPSTVVAVDLSGDVARVPFDHAWAVNHDGNLATNVWVVGSCR